MYNLSSEIINNKSFFFSGQKILHHKSNVLETVVLINPSDEAVSTEVNPLALPLYISINISMSATKTYFKTVLGVWIT